MTIPLAVRETSGIEMGAIFDKEPADWQELEEMVHQAFSEMGYVSNRSHKIKTIRGSVEIDIHAIKQSTPIPTTVLCECKYWDKAVPQSVVHGFRSVCSDSGAHFGLIISRKGFQSGAENSRAATNVHLMNFADFQKTFFEEWRIGAFMMLARMRDQLLPVFRAASGLEEYGLDLVDPNLIEGSNPFKKYSIFFGLDGSYSNFFIPRHSFPSTFNDPRGDPRSLFPVTVSSHREYLEIARQAVLEGNQHYNLPSKYFPELRLEPRTEIGEERTTPCSHSGTATAMR
jgi:hypothetical protein